MRNLIIGAGSILLLAACGSTTDTASPTQAPTAAPTVAPTPVPTPVTYDLACSYVLTYQQSEVGITLHVNPAKVDSATGCGILRGAINGINANAGNPFTISETDGTALDFTQAGPDIVQACASKDNTVKVYEHTQDPVSVQLATGVCTGIAKADGPVSAA